MTLKHNLKTRPHLNDYPQSASKARLEEYVNELVEWIEDFKEELQQFDFNRWYLQNEKEIARYLDKNPTKSYVDFFIKTEILGENSK